jgi:small subunit ribosomal protein S16
LAVKLRLKRMGKKKQPVYKIVAADSRSPRDGKFIEDLGLYNPLTQPHTVNLKEDRVNYWLNNGAEPTNTVRSLLRQKGITLKKELQSRGLSEEKIQEELEKWFKLKEATKSTVKRKSKSKIDAEKVEKPAAENTVLSEDNSEEINKEGTAEVKGAASEEE